MHPTKRGGYPSVVLYAPNRRCFFRVHELVALVFIGPRPRGLETRHLDGKPKNNQLSNLCYGTRKQNSDDIARYGGSYGGVRVLSQSTIDKIRTQALAGTRTQCEIADHYGISQGHVSNIKRGTRPR